MSGKVSRGSSGAPKGGASASLGAKVNSKAKVKAQTNSSQTNTETKDDPEQTKKDLELYNKSIEKYQKEDPSLAFMQEENFQNIDDSLEELSVTERNILMSSQASLGSRIATVAGRYSLDHSRFGSARSHLPGDNPDGSSSRPQQLTRYALTNSQLYKGTGANSNSTGLPSTIVSRFNLSSDTGADSTSSSFEAYSASYLKANASDLYNDFQNNSSFKEGYLDNVEKLYNSINVKTLVNAPVEQNTQKLLNQAGNASSKDKMQVANSFMTLLANQGNKVDDVAKSGLTVFLANTISSDGENVAGYYSTQNHMVLGRNPGFASFNATAVHELTHVLDHRDGDLDGEIRGMASNWSDLRESASDKIQDTYGQMPGLDSGFLSYSQTNDMEFLAVMTQLYQSDSSDLQRNLPKVFNALDKMFRVS